MGKEYWSLAWGGTGGAGSEMRLCCRHAVTRHDFVDHLLGRSLAEALDHDGKLLLIDRAGVVLVRCEEGVLRLSPTKARLGLAALNCECLVLPCAPA